MNASAEIREAIKIIVKDMFRESGITCTVDSVDKTGYTCDVTSVDRGMQYFNVRLLATPADEITEGIIRFPKPGSHVVIVLLDDMDNLAFVSQYGAIESYKIQVGNKMLYIDQNGIKMNGDIHQGIVKAVKLKEELDKTNEVVQAIVNSLQNWTTAPGDGGAALKTFFATQVAGKTVGTFTDIQNTNVKHG